MEVQASLPSPQQDVTDLHGQVDSNHQYSATVPPPSYVEITLHDNVDFSTPFQQYYPRDPLNQEGQPVPDDLAAPSCAAPVDPLVYPQQHENVVVTQTLMVQPKIRHTVASAPDDYMCNAICVTLFCCWPIGICAIKQAQKTRMAIAAGNINKARRHSKAAINLVIAGIVIGIVIESLIAGVYFFMTLRSGVSRDSPYR